MVSVLYLSTLLGTSSQCDMTLSNLFTYRMAFSPQGAQSKARPFAGTLFCSVRYCDFHNSLLCHHSDPYHFQFNVHFVLFCIWFCLHYFASGYLVLSFHFIPFLLKLLSMFY